MEAEETEKCSAIWGECNFMGGLCSCRCIQILRVAPLDDTSGEMLGK